MKISENSEPDAAGSGREAIPWIKEVMVEDDFFKSTDFSQTTLSTETNKSLLATYLDQTEEYSTAEVNHITGTIPPTLNLTLFENNSYNQNFIVSSAGQLFIRKFFFRTLILTLKEELITFLLYKSVIFAQEGDPVFAKVLTAIRKNVPLFLEQRQKILENERDYRLMYALAYKDFRHFLEGFVFVASVHTENFSNTENFSSELTRLEKKQLNEIIFAKKIKQFLGINEQSYQYIEQSALINQCSDSEQQGFYELNALFEEEKENFTSFIERDLSNKRILFWCCWTLSPFLAPDISDFLNTLRHHRSIRRLYTDLPVECTEAVQTYMRADVSHIQRPEEAFLHREIEKIYPIFIPDYAKETLPYAVFFENLKPFDIPPSNIECIGFDGDELMMKRPVASENRLVFSMDRLWRHKITEALEEAKTLRTDELIVFFYFLKPVYYFPVEVIDHPEVSRILHTDMFTGFGPEKPINSLARYSRYISTSPQSFAFTNISASPLAHENIIFYPNDFTASPLPLDDSPFNAFNLYNALLYSTSKGGGGQLEPAVPTHNVHFSH